MRKEVFVVLIVSSINMISRRGETKNQPENFSVFLHLDIVP